MPSLLLFLLAAILTLRCDGQDQGFLGDPTCCADDPVYLRPTCLVSKHNGITHQVCSDACNTVAECTGYTLEMGFDGALEVCYLHFTFEANIQSVVGPTTYEILGPGHSVSCDHHHAWYACFRCLSFPGLCPCRPLAVLTCYCKSQGHLWTTTTHTTTTRTTTNWYDFGFGAGGTTTTRGNGDVNVECPSTVAECEDAEFPMNDPCWNPCRIMSMNAGTEEVKATVRQGSLGGAPRRTRLGGGAAALWLLLLLAGAAL